MGGLDGGLFTCTPTCLNYAIRYAPWNIIGLKAKRGRPDGYEDRTLLPSQQPSGSHDEDDFHLGSQEVEVKVGNPKSCC